MTRRNFTSSDQIMSTEHSSPVTANSFVPWLRGLAEKGGKGVVNNIDARCLGRVADEIERLHRLAQTQPQPVAWRCKDYADGWIYINDKVSAELYRRDTDCLMQPLYLRAQCARADIAKAIAYDLENGSAHGARVVTTPHLDNYHVTGHVNLLALADAVLALSSTVQTPIENKEGGAS